MALTIEQAKEFLKKNADDILILSAECDGACDRILSAVYFYNRAKNMYTEILVIEATEAFIEDQRQKGINIDIEV